MTKLCAEAMGYVVGPHDFSAYIPVTVNHKPLRSYYPLHDDEQAMALVKKVPLNVSPNSLLKEWHVQASDGEGMLRGEVSKSTELNRAIVECVAKMQKTSPK